jgi:hypothetical protein
VTALLLLLSLQAPVSCEFDNLPCRIGEHESEIREIREQMNQRPTRQEYLASRTLQYEYQGAQEQDRDRRDLYQIGGLVAAILGASFRKEVTTWLKWRLGGSGNGAIV